MAHGRSAASAPQIGSAGASGRDLGRRQRGRGMAAGPACWTQAVEHVATPSSGDDRSGTCDGSVATPRCGFDADGRRRRNERRRTRRDSSSIASGSLRRELATIVDVASDRLARSSSEPTRRVPGEAVNADARSSRRAAAARRGARGRRRALARDARSVAVLRSTTAQSLRLELPLGRVAVGMPCASVSARWPWRGR